MAESDHVGREDMKMLSERRNHPVPVGKGGDARPRAVNEDERRQARVTSFDIIGVDAVRDDRLADFWIAHFRSEEHTSELQSLMRISYAVFCLKTKKNTNSHR